jgi:hypothetical protein
MKAEPALMGDRPVLPQIHQPLQGLPQRQTPAASKDLSLVEVCRGKRDAPAGPQLQPLQLVLTFRSTP